MKFNTYLYSRRWKSSQWCNWTIYNTKDDNTKIKSKRYFNPICRILLKPKPFGGNRVDSFLMLVFSSAVWCTKSDLYLTSAAMKCQHYTILDYLNFRNHLTEIVIRTLSNFWHFYGVRISVPLQCCSLAPKFGHFSLMGVSAYFAGINIMLLTYRKMVTFYSARIHLESFLCFWLFQDSGCNLLLKPL